MSAGVTKVTLRHHKENQYIEYACYEEHVLYLFESIFQILVITQQKMAIKSSQQKCPHLFVAPVFVLGD